jgi:hypothetical protein
MTAQPHFEKKGGRDAGRAKFRELQRIPSISD